ncbi:hypothetical protein L7F22_068647 [Adiantum nelumboides]|nr:hypothetical protein [Adiantum nelumboides]
MPNVQQHFEAENGGENQQDGAENQPNEVAMDAPQVEQEDAQNQPFNAMQPAEQPADFEDMQAENPPAMDHWKCVALSTTEAEYVAAIEATKEALWLMWLVGELGIDAKKPVLHCDSQSAITLARNPVFHAKTKQIGVKYRFIRHVLEDMAIELVKVHTDDNPADLLTSLPAERFAYCCQMMGIGRDLISCLFAVMSANGDTSSVMKGISQGACDFLLKPVRLEELQNIWQHVVRKQHTLAKDGNTSCTTQRKRKGFIDEDGACEDEDNLCNAKRQRVVWSVDLHRKFVCAINHLGLDQAVPKRILDLMNVPNLTRENVASHLQKYRLYVKKMRGPGISTCIRPSDSFLNSFSLLNGFSAVQLDGFSLQPRPPLQARIAGSPPTADSLVKYIDQRHFVNIFKDPEMQAHVGIDDFRIENRSETARGSKLVSENSSDGFLQQGLRVPVPMSILWNLRQSESELESFGRDHLFIHQLEMAGVTQSSQSDLCSSFDEKSTDKYLPSWR